jgi:hypothetical protein
MVVVVVAQSGFVAQPLESEMKFADRSGVGKKTKGRRPKEEAWW